MRTRPNFIFTIMPKILIVEDDTFLGEVLVQKLHVNGFETKLVTDGDIGLEQMREWKPDLVLLDIILPRKSGYEVLEVKSSDATIVHIPTIIISNSGQPVEINRALALGVKDYLIKAELDPEEVIAKVRLQLDMGTNPPVSVIDTTPKVSAGVPPIPQLAGKTIMWVEDDKFLSDIIGRKLQAEKCTLLHAGTGEEAFRLLERTVPDIILLDILLLGMDGFEILRRIKSQSDTKNIPVILLSNLGQKADMEKGRALGASRFLVKAMVTLDEIVQAIKVVLVEPRG